ncbi:dUTP diphosphatase [Staphylococcus felis]|uniref:dUTP diphosphatase n=1 Tax=Staphylococcus felis TaxID=46127 RepID=UPI0021D07CFA|nr:dUTP pyrophosphatase [Staphylococcus felis]UXR86190.1 dUTP pyrophosphatase [Staphylococcus felis]UXR87116.1 dUTP pyrophosphatase [Staphylococcus felis]
MTNTLQIKLLSKNATMPKREHDTDAGFDIYAAETVILEPQEKALIATDIAVNIPKGYVGLLTSRSGVSSKTHLVIETGKIDAGFHGNMKINVKNDSPLDNNLRNTTKSIEGYILTPPYINNELTKDKYLINKGDKLAQLVVVPIITPELEQVEEFSSESARGEKGFGSSGI